MFIYLLFIISYISITNSTTSFPNTTVTSWESTLITLPQNNSIEHLLIFSPLKQHDNPGDIILYTTHEISTAQIYIYTNFSKISKNNQGEYIDYDWFLYQSDSIHIKSSDPNYIQNSNYYFLIKLNNLFFEETITIYNELDIGIINSNTKFSIKHLYCKHQLTFAYEHIDVNDYIVFAFVIENPILYEQYNASLSIKRGDDNVLEQWNKFDRSLYVYTYNTTESAYNESEFYIVIEINSNETEYKLNIEMEVNTKAEIPNYCEHNSYINMYLIPNINYYFYINTQDYDINEENAFELRINDKLFLNSEALLINNYFINCEENNIKYNYPFYKEFNYYIKYRGELETKYFVLPFKKTNPLHNFFIISININISDVQTLPEFFINTPLRIKTFYLTLSKFNASNIAETEKFEANITTPIFYKIVYDNSLLSYSKSLTFYIEGTKSSTIMAGPMVLDNKEPNTNYKWSRFYLVNKEHVIKNNTITFGFLGSVENTTVLVGLVDNAVIYFRNDYRKVNQPFNMEITNCKQELYYIEAFDDYFKSKVNVIYDILYGNASMYYYNNIDSPLILSSDNRGVDISNHTYFPLENDNYNVLKIQCKTPTSIRTTFVSQEPYSEIETFMRDGDDIYLHLQSRFLYEFILDTINVGYTYKVTIHSFSNALILVEAYEQNHTLSHNNQDIHFEYQGIYSTSMSPDISNQPRIKIYSKDKEDIYIRIKMASMEIMNKVIEGNSEIVYSKRKILHKVRNDIIYDCLQIAIYSKRKVDKVKMKYTFDWFNENMINAVLPQSEYEFAYETLFSFSNPYNKYYGHNKENETFYFAMEVLNANKEDYNVYINIKYSAIQTTLTKIGGNVIHYGKKYRLVNGKENLDSIVFYFTDINTTNNTSLQLALSYGNDGIIDIISNIKENTFILYNNKYSGMIFEVMNNNNTNINELPFYINYFYTNETTLNTYILSNNTSINFTYIKGASFIQWDVLLLNTNNVTYHLYLLPIESSISINTFNTISSLSQLIPNFTVHNTQEVSLKINPGQYNLNIIAKCNEAIFQYEKMYSSINITIPNEKHILIATIVILITVIVILIALMFLLKKRRNRKFKGRTFNNKENDDQSLLDKVNQQEEGMFKLLDEDEDNNIIM